MVNLFDRKLLRRNQARFLGDFAKYNFIYHEIADRIMENLFSLNRDFETALEISAKDQYLSDSIVKSGKVKQIFQTSLTQRLGDGDFADLVADDEFLPFKKESFDLVVSNLNLQHVNLVPQFLMQAKDLLKENGIFVASFFGEENLIDLKKAVLEAENSVYGGISPRISPVIDVKTAGMLLQKAGFRNPVSSLEIVEVEYEDLRKFLRDLKFMGQGNIMTLRSRKFAVRKFLDEILNNYAKISGLQGKGARVRFEIVVMIGWK